MAFSGSVRADALYVSVDTSIPQNVGQISFDSSIATANAIDIVNPDGSSSTFVTGLDNPAGLAFGPSGNLYVVTRTQADSGRTISAISPSGSITPFATNIIGDYLNALAFDAKGNLYVGLDGYGIDKLTSTGVASRFGSALGQGIAIAPNGNIYSAATYLSELYMTTPTGVSTEIRALSNPLGLAFDNSGDLFVSEESADQIIEITPSGSQLTYATLSGTGPFPAGSKVTFYGLAFDSSGNLYVAESNGLTGAIGLVANGTIQTFATLPGIPVFIADPSVSLPIPEPAGSVLLAGASVVFLRRSGRR
jgi:streptogramin lyase